MPLTCPVCRAINDQGPNCRRCKADLSLLFTIEAQRAACVALARAALAQGRLDFSLVQMRRAGELRWGPDLARLGAVLALMRRDFATALGEYRHARNSAIE
jgi:hypothetical protein